MRAKRASPEIRGLFDLAGKVAVITGATGALGRAVSKGLAVYGVDIVICSIEEDALEELAADIGKITGRKVLPVFCDVTNGDSVIRMVNRAIDEFGRVDIFK